MITHGSTYSLLRKLKLLDEPSYKLTRDDNLQIIRRDLQKHIKKAYEHNRDRYNLRTRPQTYKIGQEVWRRNYVQSNFEKRFNAKFAPMFVKAKVREKLGNHYYKLEDMEGKLIGTFHSKDLKL
ncbi:uncharacterized protein LOC135955618 [Calliphora vicina]|uniref:uncharacterized protein LOC135955618 n=1 Tax=Calliphora vicina TaxID=7373 RepID=UPI00325AD81A